MSIHRVVGSLILSLFIGSSPDGERLEHDDQRCQAHRQLREQIMKSDREGKMNAVEKQCVVHVCSRPAIVGSSQSITLLSRNFLLDFKNFTQFIHISPSLCAPRRPSLHNSLKLIPINALLCTFQPTHTEGIGNRSTLFTFDWKCDGVRMTRVVRTSAGCRYARALSIGSSGGVSDLRRAGMFAGSIIRPDAWSGELKQVGIRIPEIQTGTTALPLNFRFNTPCEHRYETRTAIGGQLR